MITINQIKDRKGRQPKTRRATLLTGYPQKKGFCVRVYETKPKKPNSAIRKVAKVSLKVRNKRRNVIVYIPGFGPHNLQQLSTVLIRGGRTPDLPGVNYKMVRKHYDFQIGERIPRKNRRSKFSVRNEKIAARKGTVVRIG
uniref:ribosomal protein S12 n=1 Tax=Dictyostelium intermedium TaxID=361076 RepID=UPI001D126252|nr:ribosomal protein S12 [Dictyostelium intermedium]DAZ85358.1 TPA_asm: ribosomal protein S12 [Dictyostelium intermedium]